MKIAVPLPFDYHHKDMGENFDNETPLNDDVDKYKILSSVYLDDDSNSYMEINENTDQEEYKIISSVYSDQDDNNSYIGIEEDSGDRLSLFPRSVSPFLDVISDCDSAIGSVNSPMHLDKDCPLTKEDVVPESSHNANVNIKQDEKNEPTKFLLGFSADDLSDVSDTENVDSFDEPIKEKEVGGIENDTINYNEEIEDLVTVDSTTCFPLEDDFGSPSASVAKKRKNVSARVSRNDTNNYNEEIEDVITLDSTSCFHLEDDFETPNAKVTKKRKNISDEDNKNNMINYNEGIEDMVTLDSTLCFNLEDDFRPYSDKVAKKSENINLIENCIMNKNNIIQDVTNKQPKDSCTIFTELLDTKLRSYDQKTQEILMHDIDELLLRAKMLSQQPNIESYLPAGCGKVTASREYYNYYFCNSESPSPAVVNPGFDEGDVQRKILRTDDPEFPEVVKKLIFAFESSDGASDDDSDEGSQRPIDASSSQRSDSPQSSKDEPKAEELLSDGDVDDPAYSQQTSKMEVDSDEFSDIREHSSEDIPPLPANFKTPC